MRKSALFRMSSLKYGVFAMFAVVFMLAAKPASAFGIYPQDISLKDGESTSLSIVVDNTAANGVAVNLTLSGVKVTAVEVPTDLLSINTCSNGEAFTDSTVCIDIAQKTNFTAGEVVASVTVTKVGTDKIVINADGSKYSDNTEVTGDLLVKADSSAASSNDLFIILVGGIAALVLVFLVVYYLSKSKSTAMKAGSASKMAASVPEAGSPAAMPANPDMTSPTN